MLKSRQLPRNLDVAPLGDSLAELLTSNRYREVYAEGRYQVLKRERG